MAMRTPLAATIILAGCLSSARAHDTWVETNTNIVRTGDAVHLSLMLGNHGNDHRDFKIAGKASLDGASLQILGPDGQSFDVKDRLVDHGYAPNEGFWGTKFAATRSGLYVVAHRDESVFRTTRAVRSSKTYFVASPKLDHVVPAEKGFEKPLGHALELTPEVNPVVPMGPGSPLRVRLLYRGKPMPGARVSFIPRGETLKEGFDETYERTTDAEGRSSFTPKTGNWYLVVAHHAEPDERGDGYERTKYSATLTVFVPEFCSCCE